MGLYPEIRGIQPRVKKWLKPRPEYSLDCLMCAEFARQRTAMTYDREETGPSFVLVYVVYLVIYDSR